MTVIMSKFILISYNNKRAQIVTNIFSVFMDVYFSLLLSVFMGALIFQQIFTMTGFYLVFELALWIPFSIYYAVQELSLSRWLYVPLLLILCYPATIIILYNFFIYPLLIYWISNPNEMGRKEMFHIELYRYCCRSENDIDAEFRLKLIVINYLCIQSYFETLTQSDDPEYFKFAHVLYHATESELRDYGMSHLENILYTRLDTRSNIYHILKLKFAQSILRIVFIPVALLLDSFYFHVFQSNSVFMMHHKNIVLVFGILGFILFITFVVLMYMFSSKWNKFSCYMIASKHDSFVLFTSIEDFIHQCDDLLTRIIQNKEQMKQTVPKYNNRPIVSAAVKILYRARIDNKNEKNLFSTIYGPMSIITNSIIVLVILLLETKQNKNENCKNVAIQYNVIVSFIILLICFGWMGTRMFSNLSRELSGIILSLYSLAVPLYFYEMYYLNESEQCTNVYSWIIVILQTIGCLISALSR
eukprot:335385_1